MNTTQILIASGISIVVALAVSFPGLLLYRSLLIRSPLTPEEQIRRLQQQIDDLQSTVTAQEKGLEATQAEVRRLTWANAELQNAVVRLSAQVVALGGKPVVDTTQLIQ